MSGAVYQPTTVTYEANSPQQDRWQDRPISYLASSVTQTVRRPCGLPCALPRNIIPTILIISCILSFSIGLYMLIIGSVNYEDSSSICYFIFGSLIVLVAILLFACFLRVVRRICWRNAKDHMSTSGGQTLTVNPSTDLLVAAQYAPVSEVAYQPTNVEDSEQSKLMPQNNKDLTNEDTDRMVERDPRIVLRPLNPPAHEET